MHHCSCVECTTPKRYTPLHTLLNSCTHHYMLVCLCMPYMVGVVSMHVCGWWYPCVVHEVHHGCNYPYTTPLVVNSEHIHTHSLHTQTAHTLRSMTTTYHTNPCTRHTQTQTHKTHKHMVHELPQSQCTVPHGAHVHNTCNCRQSVAVRTGERRGCYGM